MMPKEEKENSVDALHLPSTQFRFREWHRNFPVLPTEQKQQQQKKEHIIIGGGENSDCVCVSGTCTTRRPLPIAASAFPSLSFDVKSNQQGAHLLFWTRTVTSTSTLPTFGAHQTYTLTHKHKQSTLVSHHFRIGHLFLGITFI